MIAIFINGKEISLTQEMANLEEVIQMHFPHQVYLLSFLNNDFIPSEKRSSISLKQGDDLSVIRLLSGG